MARIRSDFSAAEAEYRAGRFASALRRLQALSAPSPAETALLMEASEMCGLWTEAKEHAQRLSKSQSTQIRARAKAVLGTLLSLNSELDAAETHLREARALLAEGGDLERACEVGIRQFAALLDMRSGTSVDDLASELQKDVARLGSRRLLCMFHVAATNFHASAGRVDLARTHSVLARSHLKADPNCWLEASLALAECGIAFISGDLEAAVRRTKDASQSAEQSGHMWCRAAAATTCAFLSIRSGNKGQAAEWIRCAERLTATIPVLRIANLDNVAQLALLNHDIEGAQRALDLMEEPKALSAPENSWYGYAITYTRIRLNRVLANWEQVERLAVEARQLAESRSDPNSLALFAASHAESLAALGRHDEAVAAIAPALRELASVTTATLSEIDRTLGVLFSHFGLTSVAVRCIRRASQIAAHIHDAVLAEEARRTEAGLATHSGRLPENIHEWVVRLWEFATCHKQPDALLLDLFAADDFKPLVRRLELVSQDGTPAQHGGQDYYLVPLRQPGSSEDKGQAIVVVSHGHGVARLATLLLTASAEAIVLRASPSVMSQGHSKTEREQPNRGDILVAPSMLQLLDTATRIASTSIAVLITGETGTGKEVLARFVHDASDRRSRPFVAVNCSALSRELLESTLFGHRRGAFTGASESFDGLVKGAEGGTLFLDEVGDLPLDLQPKFLRFLETGEVLPLGTNQPIKVNVRVLAATNANLAELVANNRFRADLFYRLNGIHFQLPPLRSRRTEIPALARHLLERYAEEFGKGTLTLAPEAMEHLLIYDWPGNVRQLASELRRVAVLAEPDSAVEPALLSEVILAGPPRETAPVEEEPTVTVPVDQSLERALEAVERTMIARALERSHGRLDDAARLLGISRKGLFLKRRRYNIAARES